MHSGVPLGIAAAGAIGTPGDAIPNFPAAGAKFEEFREDFTDSSINAWYDDKSGSGLAESGGVMTINVPNGGELYCGALVGLDLEDSYFMGEVDLSNGTGDYSALLMIWLDNNNNAQMGVISGNLTFVFRQGGVSDNYAGTTIPYNTVSHRWWRIVSAGTTLTFQTSHDGTAWSNPFGVTRTLSGTWYNGAYPYMDVIGQAGAGGSVDYDNLGIPGPMTDFLDVTATATTATTDVLTQTDPEFVQEIGRNTTMTGATTLSVTFSGSDKPQAGDWIVIRCGRNNVTDDPATGDSITTTPGSESYTRNARAQPAGTSTAGAGCVGVLFVAEVGTTWAAGTNTITWTSPNVAARAIIVEHWRNIGGIRSSSAAVNGNTSGSSSVTTGASLLTRDLCIAMHVFEYGGGNTTFDTDTTRGTWDLQTPEEAMTGTTGNAATRLTYITVGGQAKLITADGTQTFDIANSVTTNVDVAVAVIGLTPP